MRKSLQTGAGIIACLLSCCTAWCQQLKLGNNPPVVERSAVLELNSTNQGLLFTRIADTNLINAKNPPDGMVIYFIPTGQLMVRAHAAWQGLSTGTAGSSAAWSINGNANGSVKKLGTTDNYDLPIITNNTERMHISSAGNIAIGSSTFDASNPEKLLVDAGVTNSVNAIYARGTVNKYFQVNIQNLSNGNQSSSDLVATANNGTETTNFVNLGINGSGFVYQTGNPIETGKANDCYLIGSGNDLYIVNNHVSKDLIFLAGGTASTNEVMRMKGGTERVGIATTSPQAKLDVGNNFKLGASGSILNNIIKTSISFNDNTDISYSQSLTKTVTILNVTQNATVMVNPRGALANGLAIAWVYASAANTIQINFTNSGAGLFGNQRIGNMTFDITIIQ
jgi:hypothetical protein